jgi:hypothetical protein
MTPQETLQKVADHDAHMRQHCDKQSDLTWGYALPDGMPEAAKRAHALGHAVHAERLRSRARQAPSELSMLDRVVAHMGLDDPGTEAVRAVDTPPQAATRPSLDDIVRAMGL